ncbi:MAG: DUF2577 domain-containing protein [Acidaminococcus intestini]|jgi:hypothetical protein|uniref:DUF2577 domain-containing protein n=1 Tax=Acidaminococcus intestini TaxID=187327 RepID=UPI001D07A85E|nr:DUF2577 domain-containing protein [Acidaminococcus intestini]MCB7082014.1 DUF2577 domain-containing protein [Acidaminococcus intestini]DAY91256.1 MAG TPA: Protein of unknown function (DUF2577) [Caudoviricetes sp.]
MSDTSLYQALQAVMAQNVTDMKLSDCILGTVESASPLAIRIDPRTIVKAEYLILTDLVRDFSVDITVSHTTENRAGGSGDPAFESHNHDYTGRKKIIVHNGLAVGEMVVMIRQAGGQQYVVLSRIKDHTNISGQWR